MLLFSVQIILRSELRRVSYSTILSRFFQIFYPRDTEGIVCCLVLTYKSSFPQNYTFYQMYLLSKFAVKYLLSEHPFLTKLDLKNLKY